MHCAEVFKSHQRFSAIQPHLLLTVLCILAVPSLELATNLMGKPGEGYYIEVEIGSPSQTVGSSLFYSLNIYKENKFDIDTDGY
jgi:hypothetical protein